MYSITQVEKIGLSDGSFLQLLKIRPERKPKKKLAQIPWKIPSTNMELILAPELHCRSFLGCTHKAVTLRASQPAQQFSAAATRDLGHCPH